jgi:hypothetical protein
MDTTSTTLRPATAFRVFAAGAALAAVLLLAGSLTGCGTEDIIITQFSPSLLSATAPDSIASGSPLLLKVHWRRTNGCQELKDVEVVQVSDTLYTVTVLGEERREAGSSCTTETSIRESSIQFDNPPARFFTLEVYGARERFVLNIHGGSPPAAVERHVVHVRDATKLQDDDVEGGSVVIREVGSGNVIAELTTGADGIADTTLACPQGGSRAYLLDVSIPIGRSTTLEYRNNPARCGVPERCEVRL